MKFSIFMHKYSFRHCFAMPHVRAAPSVCFADVSPSYGERPLKGRLGYFAPDKRNITKIHYRSRFAPSLGSGSTTKISHREIFSAQDDTNKVCLLKNGGSKPPPYGEIFINSAFHIPHLINPPSSVFEGWGCGGRKTFFKKVGSADSQTRSSCHQILIFIPRWHRYQ